MKIGKLDTDEKIAVIAEIGNNAEGSLSLARDMICEAQLAGADAIKFQCINPRHLANEGTERWRQLESICFVWDCFHHLEQYATELGVTFLCTPFDVAAVEFLDPLVPAWKIAARSVGDDDLKAAVLKTGKPIIQSVAKGTDPWDIPSAYVLHVVSEYPCPPEHANLSRAGYMDGYSDHTIGIDACVGAAFLGARVIEKHFTTEAACKVARDKVRNKEYVSNDHEHSVVPGMFKIMVDRIRRAEVLCSRPE